MIATFANIFLLILAVVVEVEAGISFWIGITWPDPYELYVRLIAVIAALLLALLGILIGWIAVDLLRGVPIQQIFSNWA